MNGGLFSIDLGAAGNVIITFKDGTFRKSATVADVLLYMILEKDKEILQKLDDIYMDIPVHG